MAQVARDWVTQAVAVLCEISGYGSVMNTVSRLWSEKSRAAALFVDGSFVVGPCRALVVRCVCQERKHEGACSWCCGCGWLTARVYKLAKRADRGRA